MNSHFSTARIFAAILFCAICALAENPVCSNSDKDALNYESADCLAFDDFRFIRFTVREPLFSDGTPMGDSGIATFNEFRRDTEREKRFTQNGIVYSVTPKLQYQCSYAVYELDMLEDDALDGIRFSNGENFAIYYGCFYGSSKKSDTTFAETEFQRKLSAEDAYKLFADILLNSSGDPTIAPWSFYRKDGTLKYVGDMRDGYCMNASGMKKTKRVSGPRYCK